jgi:hypothetical protein
MEFIFLILTYIIIAGMSYSVSYNIRYFINKQRKKNRNLLDCPYKTKVNHDIR